MNRRGFIGALAALTSLPLVAKIVPPAPPSFTHAARYLTHGPAVIMASGSAPPGFLHTVTADRDTRACDFVFQNDRVVGIALQNAPAGGEVLVQIYGPARGRAM